MPAASPTTACRSSSTLTTLKEKSTGIGLHLAHLLLNNGFGGAIEARNDGAGAVFIIRLAGDGALIEFPSVVEAVRCAVDIQRGMAKQR